MTDNLRQTSVGALIFDYVKYFVGESACPKVTGMLIDLPKEELYEFLTQPGLLDKRI
jgi:Poly-adenylate binding protein, unique domain